MKGNGKMTCIMGKEHCMGLIMLIGLNMLGNLKGEKWKGLDRCSLKMEISIRGSLGLMCHGEREECSWKTETLKMEHGREANSKDNFEMHELWSIENMIIV